MALRQVEVTGKIEAMDHEDIGENEHGLLNVFSIALVSDAQPADLVRTALGVGDEVRVELDLQVSVADGDQVRVLGAGRLFEGDDEDTDDLDDEEAVDLLLLPDVPTTLGIHLENSGLGGGDTADITLTFTNLVGPSPRTMPFSVDEADKDRPRRRAALLRAWGHNFREQANGVLAPWNDKGTTAMRHIAAGMAVFADTGPTFTAADWALFSGVDAAETSKTEHLNAFVALVERYVDEQVVPYTEIGTELAEKDGPDPEKNGDYDFLLRDVVALIFTFIDKPHILTNFMIRNWLVQQEVKFGVSEDGITVRGAVPFSGQNLDEWLAEGPDGRHYFQQTLLDSPIPFIPPPPLPPIPIDVNLSAKISTPETENHQLGIYAWRYLVNEYLSFAASVQPGERYAYRRDPYLVALVESDPDRYRNREPITDWVKQLLGRVPHSGMFETNGKPYQAYSMLALLVFLQAADRLGWRNPELQTVGTAARIALDYLAAEFTFQSFEGKRIAPFRRNKDKKSFVSFYGSDYVVNMFGVLTGAYVFPDDDTGPYRSSRIGQEGGMALWSLLSGYQVPRGIHDFMLNKHGGYFARVQTRYAAGGYPINIEGTLIGVGLSIEPSDPEIARPRYFQDVSTGATPPETYDVAGPGSFTPITQLFFATGTYLNSAGGQSSDYYLDGVDVPIFPDDVFGAFDQGKSNDTHSRPTTLITRGNLLVAPDEGSVSAESRIAALERILPVMRGEDEYWVSKNMTTYKSLALGYTHGSGERHRDWPQRYPAGWEAFRVHEFGIGRADFRVFDLRQQADHPLAGHYWLLGQFSKNENSDEFRDYGRGLWEVIPGHRFADAFALEAHVKATNPPGHFDNDEDHDYTWTMPTTGEQLVIERRFGADGYDQAIRELRAPDGSQVDLSTHLADLRDREGLRALPLLDAWQVDRDYGFTGRRYAHADGRGRVVVQNPFVGETLRLDSSDYQKPTRSEETGAVLTGQLPPLPGADGQVPNVGALALGDDAVFATHYAVPRLFSPSDRLGELVALERSTLTPMRQVTVGRVPLGLVRHAGSGRLYVVDRQDVSLTVVDEASFGVLGTLRFDGFALQGAAISQKHHRIYVSQGLQKRLIVVDGATLARLPDVPGLPECGDVMVDEATDRLYVAVKSAQPNRQDIVELEVTSGGQRELRRITVDAQVSRQAVLTLDPERLYVTAFGQRPGHLPGQKLVVIDRATFAVVAEVPVLAGGVVAAAVSASQRAVTLVTLSDVQLVDTTRLGVVNRVPLPAGTGLVKGAVAVDERTGDTWWGGSSSSLVRGPLATPLT